MPKDVVVSFCICPLVCSFTHTLQRGHIHTNTGGQVSDEIHTRLTVPCMHPWFPVAQMHELNVVGHQPQCLPVKVPSMTN